MDASRIGCVPIFADLPADELAYLAERLRPVRFPAEKMLCCEGEYDEHFFILMEGEVEVMKAWATPEQRLLAVRRPCTVLGEMSLFSRDGLHTASVISRTPLELLEMSRAEFGALLQRQPQIAYETMRLLSTRLDETENLTIIDLKKKNAELTAAYQALRAAHEQIVEKERLEKELEVARKIQRSLLPMTLPQANGYDFGAVMIPARAVGGDFYDFIPLDEDHLGIVVGDVTDKGVPAAMFMSLTYSLVRAEARRSATPRQTLQSVNHHLLQRNAMGMFVTLLYGVLNLQTGGFRFARAGHPPPMVWDGEGVRQEVRVGPGQPLGLFEDSAIDQQSIVTAPGGMALLFSDGLSEAMDASGRFIDETAIHHQLCGYRQYDAQTICQRLRQDVRAYADSSVQLDDFTAVLVKRQ
ncbi:MAG: PP2C family protein-serine/threonine phosphatase [Caldilineales bacterium]|nr:PP2C family protein-serine/threonine phosphatase [Caldilineales bacterium]